MSNTYSFQLLLTFDPILVEKVAYLLNEIMQDNPNVSRLYLTGVFFFIMMYTGSNVLPIAKFLKYTHIKQAFRSEEVGNRMLDYFLSISNWRKLAMLKGNRDSDMISHILCYTATEEG